MVEKLKDEKFIKKLLLIFLVLQPFLDCYLLYTDEVMNIFHFSPTTIIRFLIIGFLFILVFFNKNNKETRKSIIIYGLVILIYTILHIITTYSYNIDSFPSFKYSLTAEIFYIARMLLPICIIYIVYTLKINKEEFINLFLWVAFITSSIIVIMNLLNISLTSYGGNNQIDGSLFSWFSSNKPDSRLLASKGWFNSANQISALFAILLPVCIYSIFDKFSFKRIATLCLCILAMLMIGTRVSTIGWIPIYIVMLLIYLFCSLILKQVEFKWKNFIGSIIIGCFFGVLYIFSPLVNSADSVDQAALDAYLDEKEIDLENMTVEEYLPFLAINEEFYTKLYPYHEHEEFWYYVAKEVPYYKRGGNRNAQTLITEDINSNFKTKLSPLFGLGYSRFENAKIYMEKDFLVHYYTIGIIGIILFLSPYIIILVYKLYQILFVDRKLFNFYNIMLLAILTLPIGISFMSGHVVDELIVSLYIGFITGIILKNIKPNINQKNI